MWKRRRVEGERERELIESHTQDTVAKGHDGRFRKNEGGKNKEVRITSLELRRKRVEWTYKEKSERERNRRDSAEYLNEDKNIGWNDRKRVEVKKDGGRWKRVKKKEVRDCEEKKRMIRKKER